MNVYIVINAGDVLDGRYIKERIPQTVALDEGHAWVVITEAPSTRAVERRLELSKSRPGLVFDGTAGTGYAPKKFLDEVKRLLAGGAAPESAAVSA